MWRCGVAQLLASSRDSAANNESPLNGSSRAKDVPVRALKVLRRYVLAWQGGQVLGVPDCLNLLNARQVKVNPLKIHNSN